MRKVFGPEYENFILSTLVELLYFDGKRDIKRFKKSVIF